LSSALLRLGRRERAVRVVEALRGVSFDVSHGTVLGIIGANGAGKSTLLRVIAGILPPNEGRVEVRGRITTLLALGVGFNKSLSGRENVILGGLAAGMSLREVEEHYDAIADFADIKDFMDLPMRTYSSGMYGRLAFAVAAFMDPDILLIDEALSTGDAAFRKRSFQKMQELCAQAHTLLIVSHGLATVRELATDCIWLHQGQLRGHGDPETVIKEYTDFVNVAQSTITMEEV
jgi:ABC-type polysaccharide/polyol phosphate transport system ATPase subunit